MESCVFDFFFFLLQVQLLEVLAEEMAGYSPLKLRDIYLDIANTADKQLSGYCQYQDLYYSMSRQMVCYFISECS